MEPFEAPTRPLNARTKMASSSTKAPNSPAAHEMSLSFENGGDPSRFWPETAPSLALLIYILLTIEAHP
jgi:hypothetical protein